MYHFKLVHKFLTNIINDIPFSFNTKRIFRRALVKELLEVAELSEYERQNFIRDAKNWLIED